jgi:CheY-like chemotaxis protein
MRLEILVLLAMLVAALVVVADIQWGKRSARGGARPDTGAPEGVEPRAVVVDNSPPTQVLITRVLEEAGYRVAVAGSGQEALARLEEFTSPSSCVLAVVDLAMKDMNGLEFVRAVRSEFTYGVVRIVIMATQTERESITTDLRTRGDHYLVKPVTEKALHETLAHLAHRP